MGLNPYRGFESLSLRQSSKAKPIRLGFFIRPYSHATRNNVDVQLEVAGGR